MLEKAGHSVVIANNGREAIDILEQQPFDVILMDVQMPELDGIQATRLIRERERDSGWHTPIVAMTAHAMTGDRERRLDAGWTHTSPRQCRARSCWRRSWRYTPDRIQFGEGRSMCPTTRKSAGAVTFLTVNPYSASTSRKIEGASP